MLFGISSSNLQFLSNGDKVSLRLSSATILVGLIENVVWCPGNNLVAENISKNIPGGLIPILNIS